MNEKKKPLLVALQDEVDAVDLSDVEKFEPKGKPVPGEIPLGELTDEEKRYLVLAKQYVKELRPLLEQFMFEKMEKLLSGEITSGEDPRAARIAELTFKVETLDKVLNQMIGDRFSLWDKILEGLPAVRSGWMVILMPSPPPDASGNPALPCDLPDPE